jgi:hypothetical protein
MIYFSKKANLEFINDFLKTYDQIRAIEKQAHEKMLGEKHDWITPDGVNKLIRETASQLNSDYSSLRMNYLRKVDRANEISKNERIEYYLNIVSAPLEGSRKYSGSIYEFFLDPISSIFDFDRDCHDTLNKLIGKLEAEMNQEYRNLFNPLYWLGKFVIYIIRLPYTMILLTGFDINIIQKPLFGNLFLLLYMVGLIYILVYLFGLPIADAIKIISRCPCI